MEILRTASAPAKVLVLTRYTRKGAASRIRHFDLIPGLRKEGFACQVHSLLDDDAVERFYAGLPRRKASLALAYASRYARLLPILGRYDVIWIEKEGLPWLPWLLERLSYRRAGCATVVDFDDNWPERYQQHRSVLVRRIGADKFPRLLRAADAVTAANPVLAEMLERLGGRPVEVIYNGIDLERYARAGRDCREGPHKAPVHVGASGARLRIGWIGTPYTASEHLSLAAPMLNRLSAEGIAEVVLIGAGDALPVLKARRLAWSEQTEIEDIAGFDVGIMPLTGSRFDQGKSGWKLVQCMAVGRPVVASAVGFNTDLVIDGVNGFLAADINQFEHVLRRLAADRDLRLRMGEAAQASLHDRYGMTVTVGRTAAVLRRALAARATRVTEGPVPPSAVRR